jgi:hypothetical protein
MVSSAILWWVFDITREGISERRTLRRMKPLIFVRQLETQVRQEFVRRHLSALIYAGLGDKTNAIDHLKREYPIHDNIDLRECQSMLCLMSCEAIQISRHSRQDLSDTLT